MPLLLLFTLHFLRAKNGIAHFYVGCARLARALRSSRSLSNPIGDASFFTFFPIISKQSRKKQLLTLANFDLPRQEFFFLLSGLKINESIIYL